MFTHKNDTKIKGIYTRLYTKNYTKIKGMLSQIYRILIIKILIIKLHSFKNKNP